MDGNKLTFTPEQETAINHRGSALLVSAAAGSGKTKVLVERLLSRVAEGDDVDEFLVITYTRAAAAELRERIYDEILERLANAPENRRLRRQSMLCRGAQIGTIHSFCTDILRENAHQAKLQPDFRVADESESDMIKAEVLEEVLDTAYVVAAQTAQPAPSGAFRELIDAVCTGRDDKRLVGIILETHAKIQSNPNPRAWAEKQMEKLPLPGTADVSETIWGRQILDKTRRTAQYWHGEMTQAWAEMADLPDFKRAYGASIETTIAGIGAFIAALEKGWDEARRRREIEFPRAKPISGYEELKDARARCRAAMKKCAAALECSSDEHIEDMRAVAPAMAALLQLVLDFDSAYSEEKRRRGIVDFSDLEHLALSLLTEPGTGRKTQLAESVSQRFKEIMVDEYQDVNAVQEQIFSAITKEDSNIFMVGDVKQSIYRFRLADPSIFLAKYRSFRGQGSGIRDQGSGIRGQGAGVKIHLSKNFRSRAGILDAVNYVFGRVMSEEFGEMDYTEKERLIAGRGDHVEPPDHAVEFDIIDMSCLEQDEDEESPVRAQIEAGHIARRINELIDSGYTIPDGEGGERQVGYSDIVILLRSIRDKAWQYAAALSEHGIPADMPGGEGFFETIEVSAALSLLSVIDNPMQDIPLASTLRGPVYRFTEDELAEIRTSSRNTDFYNALTHVGTDAPVRPQTLAKKCAAFLNEIDTLRLVAPDMPADRFIWHVYNKTGLLELAGAMRGGEKRRNNLILLAEAAQKFEQNGYKGLFGFLTYIRGLQERGAELFHAGAHAESAAAADAVRIMSIHKSKGLEFPVVILADTSKRLNNKDAQQPLVMHPELGVGPMRIDRQRRIEYTTIARMAIQDKLTSEMMAEELRVLYVAMTRAREKLIMTATFADAGKSLNEFLNKKPAPQALEAIKSTAGWIITALGTQCNAIKLSALGATAPGRLRATEPPERPPAPGTPPISDTGTPLVSAPGNDTDAPPTSAPGATPPDYTYPHKNAPELPSKLTVTDITRTAPDTTPASGASPGRTPQAYPRPKFITQKTSLTAAERGTALHTAMQYIDFKQCENTESIEKELHRLVQKGFLSQEQAASVDAQKIKRFFESKIGQRILKAPKAHREFRFSLLTPAEEFYQGSAGDEILLQGIIDCFIEEEGALTVIDFKTDRITAETQEERAKHYAPQIAAYSDALERITGKRVKDRIIYFFETNEYAKIEGNNTFYVEKLPNM